MTADLLPRRHAGKHRPLFHPSYTGETPMSKLIPIAKRFVVAEEGASMAEYGLLIALIALVAAAGAKILGLGLNNMLGNVGSTLNTVSVPSI